MKLYIPTWNSERTLGKCLAYLLDPYVEKLASMNLEVTLIDHHSTDKTLDIAKEHGVTRIIGNNNLNLGEARSWICEDAQDTDWFFMVDSDVYVTVEWVMRMLVARNQLLKEDANLGAIQSNDIFAATIKDPKLHQQLYAINTWREKAVKFPVKNPRRFDTNAALIRSEAVKGFTTRVGCYEDYLLGEYINDNGWNTYAVDLLVLHDELITPDSLRRRCKCAGAGMKATGYNNLFWIAAGMVVNPFRVPSGARLLTAKIYWNYIVGYLRWKKYFDGDWK